MSYLHVSDAFTTFLLIDFFANTSSFFLQLGHYVNNEYTQVWTYISKLEKEKLALNDVGLSSQRNLPSKLKLSN